MKRSEIHPHIIEDIREWPVNKLYSRRKEFVQEVTDFTTRRIMDKTDGQPGHMIARAAYRSGVSLWLLTRIDEWKTHGEISKEK